LQGGHALTKHLVLVDYDGVPGIDLSLLDASYRAIVFVGDGRNPPATAGIQDAAHRFARIVFHSIADPGKNSLDFHIAFYLGRTFEAAPETICIVVSRDREFDPLLLHLNSRGQRCRRVESFAELTSPPPGVSINRLVCSECQQSYETGDGLRDEEAWMCGGCLAQYLR
jgi:hypothetical protein